MPRARSCAAWAVLVVWGWCAAPLPAAASDETPEPTRLDEFGDPEAPQALRERLTERQDENRVQEPATIEIGGRPLTFSGQYSLNFDYVRDIRIGQDDDDPELLAFEQEIEAEIFYPLGSSWFLFAQGAVFYEHLLHAPGGTSQSSDTFVTRGESWLYWKEPFDSRFHFEIGRLDFEDDRTWWWDDDFDAMRLGYEEDDWEVVLAAARELAPTRTGTDRIDPEQERVLRILGEVSWQWAEEHAIEVFFLRQSDHSDTERVGEVVRSDRADESDASLFWVGPRLSGAWELDGGFLNYWLGGATVWGRETLLEVDEIGRRLSRVESRRTGSVRGWSVDVGATWTLPFALEPRLTIGWAMGSGDSDPGRGTDHGFRQTGLGSNESGFGGAERFHHYGILLEPELSNLRIWTVGLGVSLLDSSSLDLAFHDYRLVEATGGLRDTRLDLELTGRHEHLGSELDLVLALEEWERLEVELRAAMLWTGSAVVGGRGQRSYGGFFSLRVAF